MDWWVFMLHDEWILAVEETHRSKTNDGAFIEAAMHASEAMTTSASRILHLATLDRIISIWIGGCSCCMTNGS